MRTKLFGLVVVLGLFGSVANAEINIEGIYSGEVVIDASNFSEPLTQPENIIIEKKGDFYTLKINEFTLWLDGEPLILIGDIGFEAVEATLQGEDVVLSKAGISNGPVVYGELPTTIGLISCVITPDGGMSVKLNVDVYMPSDEEAGAVWDINNIDPGKWVVFIDVTVTFTGSRQITSVSVNKAEKITIYPTLATDVIVVEGVENAGYSIFNQSGILAKQGKITTENVDISDLNAGIYIININGASAVFIKR